jgi:phosphopantothenoylcysteine decarboxylase/phosphopantothenate--cysteine ligase
MLQERRILLIIGGGIAAYKSLELVRLLRSAGAKVRVVLTKAGCEFVTPLSASSLSGDKVYTDLFSLTDEAEIGHIQLSRDADLVIVAPTTADLLAKIATGQADDLASTLLLATNKPILLAPAMNVRMWLHVATQRNVARAKLDGCFFIGPGEGSMACGDFGPGRMTEPADILNAAASLMDRDLDKSSTAKNLPLEGKKFIVTSGPTHEPIDPVRFIANRSSGRQGHSIAQAAAQAGAEVILVSGPVSIPAPAGVRLISVETAEEMLAAVQRSLPADVFVAAAAVADWRVERIEASKIKKDKSGLPVLKFIENPDILAEVAAGGEVRPQVVVGFAAETDGLLANAQAKLTKKGCDLIVANHVGVGSDVMGGLDNIVHIISRDKVESWPRMSKDLVAEKLVRHISFLLSNGDK